MQTNLGGTSPELKLIAGHPQGCPLYMLTLFLVNATIFILDVSGLLEFLKRLMSIPSYLKFGRLLNDISIVVLLDLEKKEIV